MILAEINNGNIQPIGGDLQKLDELNGKRVLIEMRVTDKRTIDQNAYYWGVVLPYFARGLQESGHSVGEYFVHEMCRQRFLKVAKIKSGGETLVIAESTTKLSKKDFKDYIEKIKMWASSDYEIFIPDAI